MEYQVPATTHGLNLNLSRLAMPKEGSSVIGTGDVLEVTLVSGYEEEPEPPTPIRVSEAGVADIPIVGPVHVDGLEPAEAEQAIARYAIDRGVYRRPHVTVTIKERHFNQVTVLGAVETPGVVDLDRTSSDVLGALAMAGGLTESAGTEIQILRKSSSRATELAQQRSESPISLASFSPPATPRIVQRVDLAEAAPSASQDYRLGDGDVVVVSEKEPRFVYVMGLVREPTEIEIPFGRDLRVLDAISRAGGRTTELANKVYVIRRVAQSEEPVVIQVDVRQAKRNGRANVVLGADDIVSVEETPVTFVMGVLERFIRFGLSGSVPLF